MHINRIVAFSKQVFEAFKYHNAKKNLKDIQKSYTHFLPLSDSAWCIQVEIAECGLFESVKNMANRVINPVSCSIYPSI